MCTRHQSILTHHRRQRQRVTKKITFYADGNSQMIFAWEIKWSLARLHLCVCLSPHLRRPNRKMHTCLQEKQNPQSIRAYIKLWRAQRPFFFLLTIVGVRDFRMSKRNEIRMPLPSSKTGEDVRANCLRNAIILGIATIFFVSMHLGRRSTMQPVLRVDCSAQRCKVTVQGFERALSLPRSKSPPAVGTAVRVHFNPRRRNESATLRSSTWNVLGLITGTLCFTQIACFLDTR